MGSIVERSGKHQLRIKSKLLPKPWFNTYDTREEAERDMNLLEAVLAKGMVPTEMLERVATVDDPMISAVIRQYLNAAPVTKSDNELLTHMASEVAGVRASAVSFSWVDAYVRTLKVEKNLAPGTVRKRVGALGRVFDWHMKRQAEAGGSGVMPANPFRMMPVGYSQYSKMDAKMAEAQGGKVKQDVTRDVRLSEADIASIYRALAGEKREDRERALAVDPEFTMLFELIVDTGIRLFEAYRQEIDHDELARGILSVDGSKGARGLIKPRVVPLKKELRGKLQAWCAGKTGRMFSFWDGSEAERERTSSRLSNRFTTLFRYAGIDDFSEHDLRHEATCRWFTLRNQAGGWMFSEIEICRLMGWTSTKMALRYASLRGEDLADRLL
jgi:integrase